jgi:hypothetical protein
MARVGEKLKLVAMEAIAAIGKQMQQRDSARNGKQAGPVRARRIRRSIGLRG